MQTQQFTQSSEPTKPSTFTRETIAPPVDVFENAEELLVVVDLPGVAPENVTLGFSDNVLTLSAQRFQRSLAIRTQINPEGIQAESKNGTLHIHLPKSERAKPRKIPVRVA